MSTHYTTTQAAKLLGVSATAVRRMCIAGVLKHFVVPMSAHRRIPKEALLECAEKMGCSPAQLQAIRDAD